jgi:hypothetical protein
MFIYDSTKPGNNKTRGTSWTYGVEETEVPGENHWDMPQVTDKLYHKMLYRVHVCVILFIPNSHERDNKMKKCYFNHGQREPIDSIETMVMYLILLMTRTV